MGAATNTSRGDRAPAATGLRPRWSIEAHAALAVVVLVVVAVWAASAMATQVVEGRLRTEMSRRAEEAAVRLRDASAHSLSRSASVGVRDAVNRASDEPGALFAVVFDAQEREVARQIADNRAWAHAEERRRRAWDPLEIRRPAAILDRGDVLGYACRVPVWDPSDPTRLVGHVHVGVVEPAYAATSASVRSAAALSALAVCLVAAPAAALGVRRFTRPLDAFARAARALERGDAPEPIPERQPAELAGLALTFNRMARGLGEARAALLAANANLESQVRARTRDLAAANERLALEVAEKREFLRAVSHDLAAPLRNIAGMADSVRRRFEGDLPEEGRRRLERVRANCDLGLAMLDELLELSRLASAPERDDHVDTRALVEDVARSLEHELAARGVRVVVHDPMPTVRADRGRLRHVFQNLIDNAAKHMGDRPTRRVDVWAVVERDEQGPVGVTFTVADTGPGIPEAEQAGVFQLFRRGHAAERSPGKGVGLASVRAVVERWSGRMALRSRTGEGCVFIVALPGDRVVEARAASAA